MEYQKAIINRIKYLAYVMHKVYNETRQDENKHYDDYAKEVDNEYTEMYMLLGLIMTVHNFDGSTYDPLHNRIQFTSFNNGNYETNHIVFIDNLEKFLND